MLPGSARSERAARARPPGGARHLGRNGGAAAAVRGASPASPLPARRAGAGAGARRGSAALEPGVSLGAALPL